MRLRIGCFPKWHVAAGIVAICLFALSGLPSGQAALPISGDVNADAHLTVADVVRLSNLLAAGTTFSDLALVVADANWDGVVDAQDVQEIIDVLLGKKPARYIVPESATVNVSFWFQSPAPPVVEADVVPAFASFWRQSPAESVTEADIAPARASFWFQAPTPPLKQDDTIPAFASFWYQAPTPPVTQDDTIPAFASFWYQAPTPPVTQDDVQQLGTPSFDRQ